jgi:GT2 family glycosyltransferase
MSARAIERVSPPAARPTSIGAARADEPRIAVIVPTYRRPQDLDRCLGALARQTHHVDQIVIVMREDDEATRAVLERVKANNVGLTVATIKDGGQVAALNAGLAVAEADIIAFTDDDAAPRPEWLSQIAARFAADPRLGGLGGRDWVHHKERLEDGERSVVGQITWFGRCIGHHHLGAGPCREVDALKGANMSFRARALEGVRFDTRLLGAGAQVCNDLGVSLAVKRRGWRLLYDPQIAVDHFPAARHDDDQRSAFSPDAVHNAVFNETLLLYEHFTPWRRLVYFVWAFAIGHRVSPGLLQWLRLRAVIEPQTATARFRAAWNARVAALRAAR